jgi:glycosyltransferase involved in cell wall biosynthesis
MRKKVLYITYDGLTDPLGQSQILPYLKGLALKGNEVQIISAEKANRFQENEVAVREQIKGLNIHWAYTHYSNRPPLLSTFLLMRRIKKLADAFYAINHFDIIHCRSLIPAMIGLSLKKQYASKLIFDIRGFWVDERVEGGLWNLKNPTYRLLYYFFKQQEKKLFEAADGIVSLTENAKEYIQDHFKTQAQFSVIPCSVDIHHFDYNPISRVETNKLKAKLDLKLEDYVLVYIGSLGTRYLLKEMFQFFDALKNQKAEAKMLFVTQTPVNFILKEAKKQGINKKDVFITASAYHEMPKYINLADAGIFFIHSGFTGKAVSPTKQSELLAMGLPLVTNAGVGDSESIIQDHELGVVLQDFDANSLAAAVKQLLQSNYDKVRIRDKAKELFALDKAVEEYAKLYAKL